MQGRDDHFPVATGERPTCAICQDTVGVYEPVLVLGEEHAQPTSLASQPQLMTDDCQLVHVACARRPQPLRVS